MIGKFPKISVTRFFRQHQNIDKNLFSFSINYCNNAVIFRRIHNYCISILHKHDKYQQTRMVFLSFLNFFFWESIDSETYVQWHAAVNNSSSLYWCRKKLFETIVCYVFIDRLMLKWNIDINIYERLNKWLGYKTYF